MFIIFAFLAHNQWLNLVCLLFVLVDTSSVLSFHPLPTSIRISIVVKIFYFQHWGYVRVEGIMSFKFVCESLFSKLKPINVKNVISANQFHTTPACESKINRMRSRKEMLQTVVKKEDGTQGSQSVDIDISLQRLANWSTQCCCEFVLRKDYNRNVFARLVKGFNDSQILVCQKNCSEIHRSRNCTFAALVSPRITRLYR